MPLLIVGAGNAGAWAVNLCKNKNRSFGDPVCIVDDDLTKKNLRVQGVPVRGTISDIPELVRKYHIVEIVIAITSLKGERLREVINLCNSTHCRVRMLSDPQAVDENGNPAAAPGYGLRELNTADFLSRDEIQLNNAQISEYLHDKVVLVTGGGGSIGSELCRQIIRYRPRQLLIFDIYENCAYELEMELRNKYGSKVPVVTLIGSIRDKQRLDEVFEIYHPVGGVPRRGPQARAADGGQPRRGGQEQRLRHQKPADLRRRARCRAVCAALHRQGGQPHQRHGLHQAHLRDADPDLCPEHHHEVHGGAVRQRAGQPRQRHPAV